MSHDPDHPRDPSPHSLECEDVRSALSDRVDGRLEATLEPVVGDHLARCESCRDEAHALTAIVGALRQLVAPEVGERFDAGVASRIARRQRTSRVGARIAVAAMVLLAFGLGALVGERLSRSGYGTGEVAPGELATTPPAPGLQHRSATPSGGALAEESGSPEELAAAPDGAVPGEAESATAPGEGEDAPLAADEGASGPRGTDGGSGAASGAVPPPDGEAIARSDRPGEHETTAPGTVEGTDAADERETAAGALTEAGSAGGERRRWSGRTEVVDIDTAEGRRQMEEARDAIAGGRTVEAERRLRLAAAALEGVDDRLLVEALLQRASVLQRLGRERQAIATGAEALVVADRAAEQSASAEAADAGELEALASRACDELSARLELPVIEPAAGDVDLLRDSQLCGHVRRLQERLGGQVWVEGDPDRAVGRIEITRAGLAEIAADALASEVRDFMKRYPDRYRVGVKGR